MIAAPLPPNEHDVETIRRRADDILRGADYEPAEPDAIDRAIEWLVEQLDRLIESLSTPFDGGTGGGSAGISWLLLAVGVAVLIWMVVRYRRTRAVDDEPAPESSVVLEPQRTGDEWRAEARRDEQDGAWNRAIRAEYRAVVADLVDAGLLPDVPGRTAGEYRRDVDDELPDIREPFDAATELFQPAWYSARTNDRQDLDRMRRLVAAIDVDATRKRQAGRGASHGSDPVEAS